MFLLFNYVIDSSLYAADGQPINFMPYLENRELARQELTPAQYVDFEEFLRDLEPCAADSPELLKLRTEEQSERYAQKEHQMTIAKISTQLEISCLKVEDACQKVQHNALVFEAKHKAYHDERLRKSVLEAEQIITECDERIAHLQKIERELKQSHDAQEKELRERTKGLFGAVKDIFVNYEPTPMPDYGVKDEIKVLEQKKREASLYLYKQGNKSDNCGIPRKDVQKPLLIKYSEPYSRVLGEKSSEVPSDIDLSQKDLRKSGGSAKVPSKKRL